MLLACSTMWCSHPFLHSIFLDYSEDFECSAKLKPSPIASAFDYLADEYTRRLARPWDPSARLYWLPTAANRRHKSERMFVRSFVAKLVAEKRLHPSSEKKDLLTSLVKANAEKGGEMSDAVLADTLMVLLFGGYDTTSITLSYALYLLATHADIQAQCVAEIKSILGTENSLKDPADLPYTRAVVLETLRLVSSSTSHYQKLGKASRDSARCGLAFRYHVLCSHLVHSTR